MNSVSILQLTGAQLSLLLIQSAQQFVLGVINLQLTESCCGTSDQFQLALGGNRREGTEEVN